MPAIQPIPHQNEAGGETVNRAATAHDMASAGLGSRSMANCTTRMVTYTVTRTIAEYVNVWKTAEQRYKEGYDKAVRGFACGITRWRAWVPCLSI